MRIQGDNPLIDQLLQGKDEIVFNLVFLLRAQSNVRIDTDGKCYLAVQSPSRPVWLFTNEKADARTERDLLSVLSEAGGPLTVIAKEGFIADVLTRFAKEHGRKFFKRGILNAYSIERVHPVSPVGRMIAAEKQHTGKIARLVQIAATDDNDGALSDAEAMQFAEANAGSGNLFLWEDGEVVSMARVVRYANRFTRITSVVTEREMRGRGYAKMLVGELASRLLAKGLTPVLYARAENPSSNRCYFNLGFEKQGEICEFRIL